MTFGQFKLYYKKKKNIKKFYGKCDLETSSRLILIFNLKNPLQKGIRGGLLADLDKFW